VISKTYIALAAICIGCGSTGSNIGNRETKIESGTWLVYEGSLPCADCSEIKTRLELFIDYSNPEPPYIIKQAYIGKKDEDQAVIDHGFYGILKESIHGKEATVYELSGNSPEKRMFLLRINDDTLQLVDQNRNSIRSDIPYRLLHTETIKER